jgi:hypothetical protein
MRYYTKTADEGKWLFGESVKRRSGGSMRFNLLTLPGLAWVKALFVQTARFLESLAIEGRPIPLDRHELPLVATGGRDNNSGLDSEEGRLSSAGIKGEGAYFVG